MKFGKLSVILVSFMLAACLAGCGGGGGNNSGGGAGKTPKDS